MSNINAYTAAIRINGRLIDVHKRTNHNMSLLEEKQVRTLLLEIASALSGELEQNVALTPDRAVKLSAVAAETAQADAAAEAGKPQDVWAALMRAHGLINHVMVDIMQQMG
ncbi:MAG TPA: hypothetical protein VJY34_17625 [Roseiarcus sp.]|nr:hypothetical protein [Roseiarcus sp.]